MKFAHLIVLTILIILADSAMAAEYLAGVDFEFEEKIVSSEFQQIKDQTHIIKINKGTTFQIPARPDAAQMKLALGLQNSDDLSTFATESERIELREMGINVDVVEALDPLKEYNDLSPEEKIQFENKRLQILKAAAKALHASQLAIGVGQLMGDTFQFMKAVLKGQSFHFHQNKERRHTAIQSILNNIDYRLHSQAPLVLSANELGFIISAGVIGLHGVREKGGGGILEMGLLVGYNSESKTFVVENFIAPERFVSSLAAVAVVGLNAKAGIFMANRERGLEARNRLGQSFYPPIIPAFATNGAKQFAFGFSTGLGFPPPPMADLLTFSNSHRETVTFRIEISKAFKGFVRIKTGEYKSLVKPVFEMLKNRMSLIMHGFAQIKGKSCKQVFVN